MDFKVSQIPLWEDNYIYILEAGSSAAAIDPGEAAPVNRFLKKKGLKLNVILNTHHHFDHTGGNLELKKEWGCKIYGFKEDAARIPGIDFQLQEGEKVFFEGAAFEALYVPGHTLGHIAFWSKENQVLFCGDALFAMGCGRLFEGSPKQMFESLGKIKRLPKNTLIYCAHEYSLKNARFALSLAKNNPALNKRFKKIEALRKGNKPTVPFYLEEELLTNPFLMSKSVKEFAEIRRLRDQF